jgi:hypothetical protein
MSDALRYFAAAFLLTQAASLIMLHVGARFVGHRYLLRLGQISHRQKLSALDRIWPLTRVRRAVERDDLSECTAILASLIALKSAASLVFGVAMVFWLPFASLVVPAIVAVHDPDDATLESWVRMVATLQVTSHALGAALGFAIVVVGPLAGVSLASAVVANAWLCAAAVLASLAFAIAAGRAEASGLLERGI